MSITAFAERLGRYNNENIKFTGFIIKLIELKKKKNEKLEKQGTRKMLSQLSQHEVKKKEDGSDFLLREITPTVRADMS